MAFEILKYLFLGSLYDALLDRPFTHEAIHMDNILLPNAMYARHRLNINLMQHINP